ncbi:UDP-N-acetylmuramoyl-L-alanyl-D-glutamate--2,6-diaminopimelate ligase [bioreactor metagenome]|uniref:UDP-N-acetylmuramoyl-L-alanyl-D-glutamate--2, 6-diaminopimelate ligase n=1 Tax=bioreactor metagenome TaxID=1076179 RepID=A0A644UAE6_9ZZZZ|nr:UDP-N-acetylmuramyl-tripeptide synthetase [Candidatus Elulimicrobiales bacterium]
MTEKILRKLEKFIPKKLYKLGQPVYHFLLAITGTVLYGFPARKMKMIAVTGTKGKTSTVNFIHSVLSETSEKVGLISTANIKIGEKDIPNKYHMSMPGRFILQKILKQMKNAGCKYVALEVTSEGVKQFRHLGLFLDVAIFTNLSPEHLASHGGSFEKYRAAKMKIFKKTIFNKLKLVLINKDDENAKAFEEASYIEKINFSLEDVSNIEEKDNGVSFNFKGSDFKLNTLGKFNIYNALPAILLGEKFGLNFEQIRKGLLKLNLIPGRMEEIDEGQDFKVIVDYAHEKLSMNSLLNTAKNLKKNEDNKIIIVLGGDGGGRDEQRLYDMGKVVGEKADIVIVSNSDPYFDDEMALAQKIAGEADKAGKIYNENLFIIVDRGEAIKKAIELAKKDDIVLLTTRGSLNTMSIKGKKVLSDDRVIAREILKSTINES